MEAAGPTVIDQVFAGRCHERLDGPIPGAVDVGLGEVHVHASERLVAIERRDDASARLRDYAALYAGVLEDDARLCLCGMLASDFPTLPRLMREEVQGFFADNERWLARILTEGLQRGQLRFTGRADAAAKLLMDALEGAMLVARCHGGVARFRASAQQLLAMLSG